MVGEKKYALVTGGSRGIGRAICVKLAEIGYAILINYKSNKGAADETLELVKAQGVDASLLPFDVGNKDEAVAALQQWMTNNPDSMIEVLVNNAGIRKDNLMLLMGDDEWHDVLRTNLDSFYYITKQLVKPMIANKYGRIVSVVSLSGLKGMPGQTNYSASKAGVIAATKSLAQELGRRRITVNAVAPGFISTEMTEDIDEEAYKKMIPVKRFGTADEVADVVAFLASPKASYITGEVISVNGGLYS